MKTQEQLEEAVGLLLQAIYSHLSWGENLGITNDPGYQEELKQRIDSFHVGQAISDETHEKLLAINKLEKPVEQEVEKFQREKIARKLSFIIDKHLHQYRREIDGFLATNNPLAVQINTCLDSYNTELSTLSDDEKIDEITRIFDTYTTHIIIGLSKVLIPYKPLIQRIRLTSDTTRC